MVIFNDKDIEQFKDIGIDVVILHDQVNTIKKLRDELKAEQGDSDFLRKQIKIKNMDNVNLHERIASHALLNFIFGGLFLGYLIIDIIR